MKYVFTFPIAIGVMPSHPVILRLDIDGGWGGSVQCVPFICKFYHFVFYQSSSYTSANKYDKHEKYIASQCNCIIWIYLQIQDPLITFGSNRPSPSLSHVKRTESNTPVGLLFWSRVAIDLPGSEHAYLVNHIVDIISKN